MKRSTSHATILIALVIFFHAAAARAASGDLDTTFNPDSGITAAWTVTTQADGNVLVGCSFDQLNPTTHGRVCRLNLNGTLDSTFFNNTGSGTDGRVNAIAVQLDGKILFGGTFSVSNGVSRQRLARLNSDGTLDLAFQPIVDGPVNAIVVQPNGQIVIGGRFDHVNNGFREGLARLNANGSLDTTFGHVGSGGCPSFFSVSTLALQTDGKIIAGGFFIMLNGSLCKNIARVNGNSTHDTTFDNNLGTGATNLPSTAENVLALALAPGNIYVGGSFPKFNNAPRSSIARLNADGTLDNDFAPTISATSGSPLVNAVGVQSNGKILVGGSFAQVNGVGRNNIARLNSDDTLDQTFLNSGGGPNGEVRAIALQVDPKILIAGDFTQVSGVARPGVARLLGEDVTGPVLLEENTNAAVALDSVTLVRDPFPVLTSKNFSSDGHTRVMLFTLNVNPNPGDNSAVITAEAEDSQQKLFPLTVEYAGKVRGLEWVTQINVKLTDELAAGGNVRVSIRVLGVQSNSVLIKIMP